MKHKEDMKAPAPLTTREEEMKELLKSEIASVSDVGINTKQQTLAGVAFPISEEARKAIVDIGRNVTDYVQLKIGECFPAGKRSLLHHRGILIALE